MNKSMSLDLTRPAGRLSIVLLPGAPVVSLASSYARGRHICFSILKLYQLSKWKFAHYATLVFRDFLIRRKEVLAVKSA